MILIGEITMTMMILMIAEAAGKDTMILSMIIIE